MTNEERITQLENLVKELTDWKNKREIQQISYPLDEASKNIVGGLTYSSAGASSLTQTVNVPSTPTDISVPSAYSGTEIVVINGVLREIPYL